MDCTRRDCLRASLLGLAGLGAAGGLRAQSLFQGPGGPVVGGPLTLPYAHRKLIFVFLRGGFDFVYAVLPSGDPTFRQARGPLFVPRDQSLPLRGSNFARLHPSLGKLGAGTGNPDTLGHVAWLHQSGIITDNRSHFDQMKVWEGALGAASSSTAVEGFLPRLAKKAFFPASLRGVGLGRSMPDSCRSVDSTMQMAHIDRLVSYTMGYTDPAFPVVHPNIPTLLQGSLAQHLAQPSPVLTGPVAQAMTSSGSFLLQSLAAVAPVQTYTHDAAAFPKDATEAAAAGLAFSPAGAVFAQDAEEAMQLIKNTPCRSVAIEIGGWDSHVNEVALRATLDPWLAHVLRSLYDLTVKVDPNIDIVVVSEFGRTNKVNAQAGTDHGVGGGVLVFSQGLRPQPSGVWHCHNGTGLGAAWTNLLAPPSLPQFDNAMTVATDFRTIYAELLSKRFGLATADLSFVIPNWSQLAGSAPQFTSLNLFA